MKKRNNTAQTLNGHPQPIQPMVQSAMFYPNTYINFTQAGEYTKHYYNGTERIASRLGEQQVPVSVENDQELLNYQHDTKEILRNAIGQHLYDEPTDMQEGEVFHLEFLQPCGNSNAVYYYHPNHLSSTMYVTDMQQSVVQSFLYAPYGEIISEYNTHVMGEAFPKYSFNAKELDEETGMYYYEARYYAPPVFTSRDPMFEKYFWMTPYAYCANNPVKYVDPSGEEISTHTDAEGNVVAVYNDGDNNVYRHNGDRNYTNLELKLLYSKSNTSAGGEKMGETEFWDEFISPETGNVMTNIRIQFGKSFMPIIQRMHEESLNMNLVEIAMESKGVGKFNIKNKYINVGALLNGKYATSRSAGNFLAGYNASTGSYKGVRIWFNKYQQLAGALHIQESSNNELTKSQMRQIVLYGSFTPSNLQDIYKFVPPTYGEVEYQYRMSKMGWIYGKR